MPKAGCGVGRVDVAPRHSPPSGAIFSFVPSSQQMRQDPAQPPPPGPCCCGRAHEPPPGAALPLLPSPTAAPRPRAARLLVSVAVGSSVGVHNGKYKASPPPPLPNHIHTPRPHLQPQGLRHPEPAQPCPGAPSPSPSVPGTPRHPFGSPGTPVMSPRPGPTCCGQGAREPRAIGSQLVPVPRLVPVEAAGPVPHLTNAFFI